MAGRASRAGDTGPALARGQANRLREPYRLRQCCAAPPPVELPGAILHPAVSTSFRTLAMGLEPEKIGLAQNDQRNRAETWEAINRTRGRPARLGYVAGSRCILLGSPAHESF